MSESPRLIIKIDPEGREAKPNSDPVQVYYHSWGDWNMIGAAIQITKTGNIYTIRFTQDVFDAKHFLNIETRGEVKDRRITVEGSKINDNLTSIIKTEVITVEHDLNPRPEDLFRIIL